jgi:hypothetical protein
VYCLQEIIYEGRERIFHRQQVENLLRYLFLEDKERDALLQFVNVERSITRYTTRHDHTLLSWCLLNRAFTFATALIENQQSWGFSIDWTAIAYEEYIVRVINAPSSLAKQIWQNTILARGESIEHILIPVITLIWNYAREQLWQPMFEYAGLDGSELAITYRGPPFNNWRLSHPTWSSYWSQVDKVMAYRKRQQEMIRDKSGMLSVCLLKIPDLTNLVASYLPRVRIYNANNRDPLAL